MSIDLNNTLANLILDTYDTHFPAGSFLELRTGAPAGAENAAGGTLLATVTTPASPWGAAAAGSKAKNGTWSFTGVAAGTIGHYRLKNAAGTKIEEATVTSTAVGTGEVLVDNTSITIGQNGSVSSFTKTL